MTGVDEDEIHAMVVCQLASEICIHIQENGFNYRVEETLQIASKATMSLAIEYRGVLGNSDVSVRFKSMSVWPLQVQAARFQPKNGEDVTYTRAMIPRCEIHYKRMQKFVHV